MKKRKRGIRPSPSIQESRRVPEHVTDVKKDYKDKMVLFSFEHLCERYLRLEDLQKPKLKEVRSLFKLASKMRWDQLINHSGIRYKQIPRNLMSYEVPDTVPEDVNIYEMRASREHRIWGFQVSNVFYVLWFDPNHKVIP